MLLMGMVGGAAYAAIPALLKTRFNTNEILSSLMLVYVAQAFRRPELALMDDPFDFAEVQAINSYFCSGLHINHSHRMRGPRWVDAGDAPAIAALRTRNVL